MSVNNMLSNLKDIKQRYAQLIKYEDIKTMNDTIKFLSNFNYKPVRIKSWTCPECKNKLDYNNTKNQKTCLSADLEGNIYNNYLICCDKYSREIIYYSDKWTKIS